MSNREMTPWESLMTTVVQSLISSLPGIIRNGYKSGGVTMPPYTNISLPDLNRYDTEQKLALCAMLFLPVETTLLSIKEGRLNGLDTISSYGNISFPVQDIEMHIPIIMNEIVVVGKWSTESKCQKGTNAPVTTAHGGTFTIRLANVQITIQVKLDQDATSATDVQVRLTDKNGAWGEQPTFNPDKDVTFDTTVTPGQKAVMKSLLNSSALRSKLRDPVKGVIENGPLGGEIRKIVNKMLGDLLG